MDVKKAVQQLVRRLGTTNPFAIAGRIGIPILYCPLKTTLGRYTKYCRIKTIIINSNAPEESHSFICAHELAHAILHPSLNSAQLLHISACANTTKYEKEANTFAVELLLPDNEIAEHTEWTEEFFSNNYGIPLEMIRLKVFPNTQMRFEW